MSTTRSKIRLPPSGTEIVGSADGDILVWHETDQLWEAEPGPSAPLPLSSVLYADRGTTTPLAEQNGAIETPTATVQLAVNLSPTTGATIEIVGGNYSTEDVTVTGASKVMAFISNDPDTSTIKSLTCQANFRADRLQVLNNVSGSAAVELVSCAIFGTLTAVSSLSLVGDPAFGTTTGLSIGAVVADTLTANRWSFSNTINCTSNLTTNGCNCSGNVTALGVDAVDTAFSGTLNCSSFVGVDCSLSSLTCTGDATLTTCTCGALSATGNLAMSGSSVLGITVGVDADIRNTVIGGNVSVTGNLVIDSVSYLSALQAGHTFTVSGTLTVVGGAFGQVQKQLAWNLAANSNTLTLLAAGHPAGLYAVNVSLIVRANATSLLQMNATLVCSGISKSFTNIFSTVQFTSGAVPRYVGASADPGLSGLVFYSDGSSAITVQLSPNTLTGTPSVDIFASASLAGVG